MVRPEVLLIGGAAVAGAVLYFGTGQSEAAPAPSDVLPTDLPTDQAPPSDPFGGLLSLFSGGSSGDQPLSDLTQGMSSGSGQRFTGLLAQLPPDEVTAIFDVATAKGIDPVLLGALRKAENGGPQSPNPNYPASGNPYRGGEFGIQTLAAPTFRDQAEIAANTIVRTIGRYQDNTGKSASAGGRYTADFIQYFSQGGPGYGGYAPTKSDPLNAFHYQNLLSYYQSSSVVTV